MARRGRKRKVERYTPTVDWRPSLMAPTAMTRSEPVRLDLFALCCWAYGQQRAHRLLRTQYDFFLFDLAADDVIEGGPRPAVHRDAAAVHRAVVGLDRRLSASIIRHAVSGEPPEQPTAVPQPGPMFAYPGMWRGDGDYLQPWPVKSTNQRFVVSVAETVAITEPVVEQRGRTLVVVGEQVVGKHDVEFCPLVYTPDSEWLRMEWVAHETWREAMRALLDAMQDVKLRSHIVTGWDDPGAAQPPLQPIVRDSRRLVQSSRDVVVGIGQGGRLAPGNGHLRRLHARAEMR